MIAFGINELKLHFGVEVWNNEVRIFFVIHALEFSQTRLQVQTTRNFWNLHKVYVEAVGFRSVNRSLYHRKCVYLCKSLHETALFSESSLLLDSQLFAFLLVKTWPDFFKLRLIFLTAFIREILTPFLKNEFFYFFLKGWVNEYVWRIWGIFEWIFYNELNLFKFVAI